MGAMEGSGDMGGPILIGIGGLGVDLSSRLEGIPSSQVMMVDTDRRSKDKAGRYDLRIVGTDIVGGEGSGGNLNLARACFRKDMEDLATTFLPRSPVIILSSSGGATGLAGSAEIGGMLVRTDRPSFSVLVRGRMEQSITDTNQIATVMLDGPLRPGCLVSLGACDERHDTFEEVRSEEVLISFLGALLKVFSGDAPLPMDISALQALRREGGVHKVHYFGADEMERVHHIPPPRNGTELVLIGVGRETTVERMRKLTGTLMEGRPETHIGFYPLEGTGGPVRGFIIRKADGMTGEQTEGPSAHTPGSGLGPADPVLGSYQQVDGGFAPIHR